MTPSPLTELIGVNTVESIFLREFGWIFRAQPISDYGIDAQVEVVENDRPIGKLIALQIKTGPSYFKRRRQNFVFYGEMRHLDYWTRHSLPVFLILHDPDRKLTLWQKVERRLATVTNKGWSIEIPATNILSAASKESISNGIADDDVQSIRRFNRALDLHRTAHTEDPSIVDGIQEPASIAGSDKAPSSSPFNALRVVGLENLRAMNWSTSDLLDKIIELDYRLYENLSYEIVGDTRQWLKIFEQNPDTWRVLVDPDRNVAGYWQTGVYFPDLYSSIKQGHLIESAIRPEHYDLFEIPAIYNLYFVSTCLHPAYRNPGVRIKLMDSFFSVINRLSQGRVFFNEVTTNAYSSDGLQLCKAFRLEFHKSHFRSGEVYSGYMGNVLERYKARLMMRFPQLIRRYRGVGLYQSPSL